MGNANDNTIVCEEVSNDYPRKGPGWLAFLAAATFLVSLGGVGFALIHSRYLSLERSEQSLSQNADDLSDQLAQAQAELSDIRSALAETSDQQQATINIAALSPQVLRSVVEVSCGGLTQGSGFAVDVPALPTGYRAAIITNHHVIRACTATAAKGLVVTVAGKDQQARLASWDEAVDVALLYTEATVPALRIAATPKVGQPVMAAGSPNGAEGTVDAGTLTNIEDTYVTHSAGIGPGSSGGPLVDREGLVIGIHAGTTPASPAQNIAVRMREACRVLLDCGSG